MKRTWVSSIFCHYSVPYILSRNFQDFLPHSIDAAEPIPSCPYKSITTQRFMMRPISKKHAEIFLALEEIMHQVVVISLLLAVLEKRRQGNCRNKEPRRYCIIDRIPDQVYLTRLVSMSDEDCKDNLRMNRAAFTRLCFLLENLGGLRNSRYVTVEEMIALFLRVLSHPEKNRIVKFNFIRSSQTISKYFHMVLKAVLKLHSLFFVDPTPIPDDCSDPRWQWFKGCLGALDGTYIDIKVPELDKARYRNRKGLVSVNVLGVCDKDMNFIYVLPGWEGSAADSRVLRDAVSRTHGLKVPKGNYYLCDNGYPNGEGFLTPYKGVRYHLDGWNGSLRRPQTFQEYFNMKHTRARNVIERAFGLLKIRWGILRSPSYYPIKVHNRIIVACCLLHNFIRREMIVDPMEHLLNENYVNEHDNIDDGIIDTVEASPEWTTWRDNLAQDMFNEWRHG
ncbi:hypothetical protein OROMI_018784 [Orobanche minor]